MSGMSLWSARGRAALLFLAAIPLCAGMLFPATLSLTILVATCRTLELSWTAEAQAGST